MENETQEEKTKRFNGYTEMKGKKIDGLTFGGAFCPEEGITYFRSNGYLGYFQRSHETDLKEKSVFETGKR